MTVPHYHVIFRTCDAVQALRGTRPFGLDKRTLIKICFLSLYESREGFSSSIHILGDKVSPQLQDFFAQYQTKDSSITFSNGDYGNDESIRQSLELAKAQEPDTWVYLCEDDYLHSAHAFTWMNDLIVHRESITAYKPNRKLWYNLLGDSGTKPLAIHPADYPDRYKPTQRSLSLLFLGNTNHWRQINYTTFTVLAQARTFQAYYPGCFASATGADDAAFSKALLDRVPGKGKALGLSPIPGIATHMHEDVMTPLVDWKGRVEELRSRL